MHPSIRLIQAVVAVANEKAAEALLASVKKAKCWEGYERVPGTKPMTPGSCRPVGGKKEEKKKEEKKAFFSSSRDELAKSVSDKLDMANYLNTDNLEALLKRYSKIKPMLKLMMEEQGE